MIFYRDGHGIRKFAAHVVYARICQYADVVENLIYIFTWISRYVDSKFDHQIYTGTVAEENDFF